MTHFDRPRSQQVALGTKAIRQKSISSKIVIRQKLNRQKCFLQLSTDLPQISRKRAKLWDDLFGQAVFGTSLLRFQVHSNQSQNL